jgi:fructose/tagatose bisphosphate aldolase
VALLLDHAKHIPLITRAVDLGFQAVMYDGSALPLAENIANTQAVSGYARGRGCFVEGEVGHVARDGEPAEWEHLTAVDEALAYWNAVEIDALAVAVGSRHGHYRSAQDINVERVGAIYEAVAAPLVLHGGSGLPAELFHDVIHRGVAKVNIGTELRRVWWATMDASRAKKPREALLAAREAVAARATQIIRLTVGE